MTEGKLVYVAYRYNDVDAGKVLSNIGVAHQVAFELIKKGYYPYVPHADCLIAIMFGKSLPLEYYYKCTMAWLEKSDAIVVVVDGKPLPKGVVAEMKRAMELGLRFFRAYVNFSANEVVIEEWAHPVLPEVLPAK